MELTIDPEFQALIPPLTDEEYAGLEHNIREYGCRVPIDRWGTTIVDGHNRYAICQQHGIPFETKPVEFPDRDTAKWWILRNQLDRRNLNAYQRSLLALQLEPFFQAKAKQHQGTRTDLCPNLDKGLSPIDTKREVATLAAVSHGTLAKVKKIQALASPEIQHNVASGVMSIHEAYQQVKREEHKAGGGGLPHVSHNSGEQEWYTPQAYLDAAREVLGAIDLDPASTAQANHTVQATTYYTVSDDGLSQPWAGRVWMNPPYTAGLIDQFCLKLKTSVACGDVSAAIVLVNNATETQWFVNVISVASAVVFPTKRVRFLAPDGAVGSPLQGQACIYIGQDPHRFLEVFRVFGWGARV